MSKTQTYRATLDSSPGASTWREDKDDDTLVLEVENNDCACGCRESRGSGAAYFRQGHDQKLKAKLARAELAGVEVAVVQGGFVTRKSPLGYAAQVLEPEGVAQVADLIERGKAKLGAAETPEDDTF